MKKLHYIAVALLLIITNALSYQFGETEGKKSTTTSAIAERYFQVLGNPSTQEEQCEMDFIIYNDLTECQP
jgi:hypothetical protein